ncbi:MAG: septum formation protein Maf [SAR324 cluster bacterium]|nr:septum formation protein Maf [SAR324 cluster bacterium]
MMFKQNRKFILASGSPRRKQYFERYNLQFGILTSSIDESVQGGEDPVVYARRLAREKGLSVAGNLKNNEIVIAADTIVVIDNRILGKPKSQKDVLPMLLHLNGNSHLVITAYFIFDCQSQLEIVRDVTSKVIFNKVSKNLLVAYAALEEPLDKAGAYSIQGIGTFLVQSIEGSYNNIVGLPIESLIQDLLDHKFLST